MFNYVTLEFPTVKVSITPDRISSFIMRSENFAHESAFVRFRDWDVSFDAIKPNTPVAVTLKSSEGFRKFHAYVHYVNPIFTPGQRMTEIMLVGASYVMNQAQQRIFTNVTADQVIKQIAASYRFAVDAEPHPRVWEQIAQAGHTDLELMTQLAKHSGYNLRIVDTTVHFKPHNFDFGDLRSTAPMFIMRDPNDPQGSTLFSFNLLVGDALDYGSHMKSAVKVSGVDSGDVALASSVAGRDLTFRTTKASEVFDRFATDVVAPAFDIAYYESLAQEARNRYPYRALVVVSGHPEILPSMPIYLDGLNNQYSGYWIPLKVEHTIHEESLNKFTYTTVMEVGADSLGAASVWKDGKTIPYPKSAYKKKVDSYLKHRGNKPVTKGKVVLTRGLP